MHAMNSCCKSSKFIISSNDNNDNEEVRMPGFRFHPTDEELVGFYLRRKVENKPLININEHVREIDIYEYDPWDLPKTSDNHGGNQWYFFCKRMQKYKNSTRPNRVTTSGFWKVTDIDKPVFPEGDQDNRGCIGLRKTLMYYRGRAGRCTKTEWMMHEFRLLCDNNTNTSIDRERNITEQAEVWTVCRITKRNSPYRNQLPLRRTRSAKSRCESSGTYSDDYQTQELSHLHVEREMDRSNAEQLTDRTPDMASSSNLNPDEDEFYGNENWDELAQVVRFAFSSP